MEKYKNALMEFIEVARSCIKNPDLNSTLDSLFATIGPTTDEFRELFIWPYTILLQKENRDRSTITFCMKVPPVRDLFVEWSNSCPV